MLEARKQEEVEFHDRLRTGLHDQRWSLDSERRLKDDPRWSNFKYYAIERHSLALMKGWLDQFSPGATVLDYCCGNGEESIYVAKRGAKRVVGIDISPVSIENCQKLARQEGVEDRVEFRVMDAEALEFPNDVFDFIMEYGVLHHLVLDRAMAELARVLKPQGSMVGTETLGHNPFIRAYRRLTPNLRTAWEADHILTRTGFDTMARSFAGIEPHFFHLATLAAVPLRATPVFSPVLEGLRMLDQLLLRIPGLRWQAWQVVFKLTEPSKTQRRHGPQ